jgi:protocatechuate 3,4-dioxygenase beta subunit
MSDQRDGTDQPAMSASVDRRTAMTLLGGIALGAATAVRGAHASRSAAFAQSTCVLTPEQMEGPYYLDLARVREDITEGKPGVPLRLAVRIVEASASCAPIGAAVVDVWHCDALGIYSGYEGAAVAPTHVTPVNAETFLRGTQVTASDGRLHFRTIYPGWYTGRTTHVHVKIRLGTNVATTQLYFPEDVTSAVYRRAPYSGHPNRDTSNEADTALKAVSAPPQVMWTVTPDGEGYLAATTIAIRRS